MIPSIIQIGDVLVSSDIVTECFACDYEVCKGACCIIGDSGAPLLEGELQGLEDQYPRYKDLMSEDGRARISETGFYEVDQDGDLVTPLLHGGEECAYTRMEDGNCFCAIERACCRKPISCRLYPIRARIFSNGMIALNLHRWDICRCAFDKGRREGIRVYEFLKDPLTDAYGEDFYRELCSVAEELRKQGN